VWLLDSLPTPLQNCRQLWVTKWVDYSNKYGFGYQLSDGSVGILYNDMTRMLLHTDGRLEAVDMLRCFVQLLQCFTGSTCSLVLGST